MNRPNISRLLTVNGKRVPGIQKYNISMEDIDTEETQRDENGTMHRKVLRKKVKKLTVTCAHDDPEILEVATLVQDDTFEAEVFCPGDPKATDYYITTTFYVSKIVVDLIRFKDGKGTWSVSFSAVEV